MIKKNMIRYGRRNAVVPIMERIVEDDLISESDEERLIHFPFGFIHLVHNLSKDLGLHPFVKSNAEEMSH